MALLDDNNNSANNESPSIPPQDANSSVPGTPPSDSASATPNSEIQTSTKGAITPTSELTTEMPMTDTSTTQEELAEAQSAREEKPEVMDFATALEAYSTPEAETATGEERVLKGTVLKVTGTHVVVDIGQKSEGLVPIAE